MGQEQYLMDSNVVIDYLGKRLSENSMQWMDAIVI